MAGYGAERSRSINQKDEIVTMLRNGMTVITKRVSSPVVAVRGYVRTGGVYEGQWLGGGLSHLLEHLVAGGSSERRTEAENRDLLQRIGNDSNAYTSEDHTAYFINTTAPGMESAVDLVTGWMLGAKITVPEYRREYEVVQRELEMGTGEPDRQFYYLTALNRYRVSPARVPVIGYQEVIQGLSRDDVYAYYKQTYQPNNMVIAVTGDLDPEAMLEAVQKNVADARPGREFSPVLPPEPPVLSPRTVVATFPKLGQARLQLGFPSVRLDQDDLYPLDLLAQVMGGGESSLLVEEIRDKKQLVSAIEVSDDTPAFVKGTFAITMELDAEKIAAATNEVLEQIEAVKTQGVDAARLARAKTRVKASRVKGLQTSESIAASLATDLMSTGDPHFSDRYVREMQKVTAEQLQEAAVKYLDRARLLTTVMMPAEFVGARGLPKAEELIRPVVPTTQPGQEQPASPVARIELEDGTVLLAKRISTSALVVINMYSLGGLTAEDAKTNGLGNLTMEMLMRGTKSRSAQQIAELFDSIGGDMNTACGNNSWYWNATCLKADLEKAFEAYADVVNEPAFDEAELRAMKGRVIAQIRSQDADWTNQSFRFFKKVYFAPSGSPYQFLPIGTENNVNSFSNAQLRDWYASQVLRSRRVLAVYGDVEPKQAERLARKYLVAKRKRSTTPTPAPATQPSPVADDEPATAKPTVAVETVQTQKTEQPLAAVVIGYDSASVIGEPAVYALDVADTMASGWTYPTGYLHEILRGRGLVYVVQAQNWLGRSPQHPGTFMVYAGCDPKNVNEVVDVILENIARLQAKPADLNEQWFGRSKELIVVSDALENETPAGQAATAALDELNGLGYDDHQRFADKIRAVHVSDVRTVARRKLSRCIVTVSTPRPELVRVKQGRRDYDSFPPVDLTPRGVQHDTGGAK